MLMQDRCGRFVSVVRSLVNPLILVTQVDPDAIASAIGLAEILLQLSPNLKIQIAYCGSIAHPQNKAIFNRFGLNQRIDNIDSVSSLEGRSVILVDSSSVNESRIPERFRPLKPVIVIDHHRGGLKDEDDSRFIWVEDIGAASTLIIELYNALGLPVGRAVQHSDLLLALGIHTDTRALAAAYPRDLSAYNTMMRTVNQADFERLMNFPLPPDYFHHLQHALESRRICGSRLVTSIGVVEPGSGDDASSIADILIRMTGMTLVVVSAIIGNSVRLSARCTDPTMSLNELLKKWFGEKNGGAKHTADGMGVGGALVSINLGFWFPDQGGPATEAVVLKKLEQLVFA